MVAASIVMLERETIFCQQMCEGEDSYCLIWTAQMGHYQLRVTGNVWRRHQCCRG